MAKQLVARCSNKKELLSQVGGDIITDTTAKQKLTALATREVEGRRINQLHSMEPSKVYSQWRGDNTGIAPPKLEMEQYWKSMKASPI